VVPPIIDVRPTRLQRGDTLIVEGERVLAPGSQGLTVRSAPAFRGRGVETRVILDGTFTPPLPGKPIARRVEFGAHAAPAAGDPAWAEQVLLAIDGEVERQIGRARFVGRVGVAQRDRKEARLQELTVWTAGTTELVFFPPSMRGLATQLVGWLSNDRMAAWLGVRLRGTGDALEVAELLERPGAPRPAGVAAGLQVGDRIFKVAGRAVRTADELTIAARLADRRVPLALGVKRGGREVNFSVDSKERPLIVPTSVISFVVMLVFGVIALTVAMVISGVLTWVERRVAGRMQSRVGPNRVGPFGFLQWLADGIKLLLKEDIIPDAVDRPLFKLAPYLVFMGLLGTFVVIPFGQKLIVADLNVGILYLIAITGFVALGLMMAGWSSNNKWSLLGGMRSAAQIMSYEIPAGLALMVPAVIAGTLSTQGLVENQGGWPWQWHLFDNPLAFGCFFIYFISALAEGNRTPFDLPEAESELVAGYNIEYSGWRFAVFFLSEWANLFVVGAIATTVFLGGWQIPGVDAVRHAGHWGWGLLGLSLFFAKAMTLVFVIIWIRWTLPRFRVDQMMGLCWKYFVPWTFAAVLFQALWLWLAPPSARSVMQFFTFAICGLGLTGVFFARVAYNWKQNPEEFSWKQLY
jgi:NADH:ubiquinone oxidoreductase subunit H